MSYVIRLEDLVGNAFIILRKNGNNDTFISFRKLEEYGAKIIDILNKKGFEVDLHLNRYLTSDFFEEYEDFFTPMTADGENGVGLVGRYDKSSFIRKFQGYLPLDMLLAFLSAEATEVLVSSKKRK